MADLVQIIPKLRVRIGHAFTLLLLVTAYKIDPVSKQEKKPEKDGEKIKLVSNEPIYNVPKESSPDDYEISGSDKIEHNLVKISLKRPYPPSVKDNAKQREWGLKALQKISGVGEVLSVRLWENRSKFKTWPDVAKNVEGISAETTGKWQTSGYIFLHSVTTWDPPIKTG